MHVFKLPVRQFIVIDCQRPNCVGMDRKRILKNDGIRSTEAADKICALVYVKNNCNAARRGVLGFL